MADNDDLLDYEDEEQTETTAVENQEAPKKDVKGTYVSIHSSGFRDFLLKPEILRAIVDCGFEHPSEGEYHYPPPCIKGTVSNYPYLSCSSARVHSAGRSGHGHPLPGQVRYGQDCRLRSGHAPTAGAIGQQHLPRPGHVPHPRAGLPDQQGV